MLALDSLTGRQTQLLRTRFWICRIYDVTELTDFLSASTMFHSVISSRRAILVASS